jgi:hypothetical protein
MTRTKADRAAFLTMFEDVTPGAFWHGAVLALDRLTREGTLKMLEYLQRLDSYGVGWKSFTATKGAQRPSSRMVGKKLSAENATGRYGSSPGGRDLSPNQG